MWSEVNAADRVCAVSLRLIAVERELKEPSEVSDGGHVTVGTLKISFLFL